MKIQIVIFTLFLLFTGIVSCKTQRKSTENQMDSNRDNSMTSLDWPGSYRGILPCGDCGGLKTQLILNNDRTYLLRYQYIGKSDSVFTESGKFLWNKDGNTITTEGNGQLYQVGENVLFHLDIEGKRITGNLAENYKLLKEDVEITGKYWRLVRLNGQPVKDTNREPFIRLNSDGSVNGNSSCNQFNGNFELSDGNRIKFSPFAITKMACIDNNTEFEFMHILEKTVSFSVTQNELIFQDEFETSLAIFESNYFK